MIPVEWPQLTKSSRKAEFYRHEVYFREAWNDLCEVAGDARQDVWRHSALIMLRPEGLLAGKLPAVTGFLDDNGFRVVAAETVHFDPLLTRELWRYQHTLASLDRLAVVDQILAVGPALLLLTRTDDVAELPATVRLSTLKGASNPAMRPPGTLRERLGQPNRLFALIHCADEPVDLVRELGILLEPTARRRVLESLVDGRLDDAGAARLAEAQRGDAVRDLDPAAALRRLVTLADAAGDAGQGAARMLSAVAHGRPIPWRAFLRELERAAIHPDLWDLALVGSSWIEYDEPGATKLLGGPDVAAWRGVKGVHGLVRRWVTDTPAAIAVRDTTSGRELTYAQLWDASAAVAAGLRDRGAGPGAVVALAMARGVDLMVAALGVVRCGAAYLPLDPAGPVGRWTEIVRLAGAAHVIVAGPDDPAPEGPQRVEMAALVPASFEDVDAPAESPLCVNYTSGTTGRPKGVVVPHRAVHRLVVDAAYCPLGPGDTVGSAANPAFDATTFELWSPLTAGATVAVLPDLVGAGLDAWLDGLGAHGVGTMFLTTSLFHMIARERPAGLAALHTLLVGGEQLELALAQRVLAAGAPRRLVNVYGPTETTTFATFYDCTRESLAGVDRVPIGHPLQATWVDVVDGELVIGGPGVALGYLGQPELTARRFVDTGDGRGVRYRTGDQARRLAGGAIEVLGRQDRQVKMRGFRIELPEIEGALLATGQVDVAVVEKVGEDAAAYLVAFVLPAQGIRPTAAGLRAALAPMLPEYMVPNRWQMRDSMPLGSTGKIDRGALLRGLAVAANVEAADGAADGPLERLTSMWCEVLGIDHFGQSTDFISMGGNSILAVQLSARVRETLGVPCEPMDVLLADDVADLASRLARAT